MKKKSSKLETRHKRPSKRTSEQVANEESRCKDDRLHDPVKGFTQDSKESSRYNKKTRSKK